MWSVGAKFDDGHYRVIRELGQGGMGIVLLCHDELLQRDVAIKMLLPELISNQGSAEVFLQEARLAAQLEHPNIVTVFSVGQEHTKGKDRHFIAMEYLSGGTLAGRITKKQLSIEHSLSWMKQLANGLSFAHKRSVIHQDIKADNVFVTAEGDLKIGDFGLARLLTGRMYSRIMGKMGTPAYMSPELCRSEPQDHRSDIYSLGILFFEMSTGELPFRAQGAIEMAIKHTGAPIPSARKINPAVPEVLDGVIQKMMAKAPADRYQSMQEVLAILDDLIFELRVDRLGLNKKPKASSSESATSFFTAFAQDTKPGATKEFFRTSPSSADHNMVLRPQSPETSISKADSSMGHLASSSDAVLQPDGLTAAGKAAKPSVQAGKKQTPGHKLCWSFKTKGPIGWKSTPILGRSREVVYVASADGCLYALDSAKGSRNWAYRTNGPIVSSPLQLNDQLLIAGADGLVHAVDLQGLPLWQYQASTGLVSTPGSNRDILLISTMGGELLAIDIATGKERWRFQSADGFVSSPQCRGDLVYISSRDGNVYALSAGQGVCRWTFKSSAPIIASPALSVDAVYIGGQDGTFYCIDAESGRLCWQYSAEKPISSQSVIVFTSVIFADEDRWLYCVDKYDGSLKWKAAVRGRVLADLVASSDDVYACTREGAIHSYLCHSGQLQWTLKCDKRVESAPLIADDMIYVGTIEGDLLAFKRSSAALEKSR